MEPSILVDHQNGGEPSLILGRPRQQTADLAAALWRLVADRFAVNTRIVGGDLLGPCVVRHEARQQGFDAHACGKQRRGALGEVTAGDAAMRVVIVEIQHSLIKVARSFSVHSFAPFHVGRSRQPEPPPAGDGRSVPYTTWRFGLGQAAAYGGTPCSAVPRVLCRVAHGLEDRSKRPNTSRRGMLLAAEYLAPEDGSRLRRTMERGGCDTILRPLAGAAEVIVM